MLVQAMDFLICFALSMEGFERTHAEKAHAGAVWLKELKLWSLLPKKEQKRGKRTTKEEDLGMSMV